MTEKLKKLGPEYRTGDRRISMLSRIMPTVMFYLNMFVIVYKAAKKGRRSLLDKVEWAKSSYSIIRSLEDVGVRIEISGLENVEGLDGQCVFVANHMSILETFILPAILLPYKDVSFIIKRGLVRYPVFRHIMLATDAIVVDRKNPRDDLVTVLREGERKVNDGKSVVVFPQTTRVTLFDPKKFNTLGVKLAKRAGVPLIPIALKTDAWGHGSILKDFGRVDPRIDVHLAFGRPIFIRNRGTEEHENVIDFIHGKLKSWGSSGGE